MADNKGKSRKNKEDLSLGENEEVKQNVSKRKTMKSRAGIEGRREESNDTCCLSNTT